MSHAIYRVTFAEVVAPYTLRVRFDDGVEQVIDFQPVLTGGLYGQLRDPNLFNAVRIDPEIETLVWPNGSDFDPATLHDWPDLVPLLIERARQWQSSAEALTPGK
jgi:hypothetical protein